jgi:hypothetical protein
MINTHQDWVLALTQWCVEMTRKKTRHQWKRRKTRLAWLVITAPLSLSLQLLLRIILQASTSMTILWISRKLLRKVIRNYMSLLKSWQKAKLIIRHTTICKQSKPARRREGFMWLSEMLRVWCMCWISRKFYRNVTYCLSGMRKRRRTCNWEGRTLSMRRNQSMQY